MSPQPMLAHRVDGAGEAVLLLNGGMMTISGWDPVAEILADRFRVVRCDLRGQLLSPGGPPDSLEAHAGDLAALLDHLGLERVHVLGTSFGAEAGILFAALHPGRTASLLAATAVDRVTETMRRGVRELRSACRRDAAGGDRQEMFRLMTPVVYSEAFLAAHGEALAGRLAAQAEALPAAWFAGVDALLGIMETLDLRSHLAEITCPALVVSAAADRLMPAARSRALARGIPGARHLTIPGAGHALVVEQPRRLASAWLDFAAGARDPGPSTPPSTRSAARRRSPNHKEPGR